jgi:predicted N-formylglutamate amidohydrolase
MPPLDQVPPLLAADEPPPVEIENGETLSRPGRQPMLLIVDHASRRVPRALDALGLGEAEFERHIAWDIGAAEVARQLGRTFAAPIALAGYSRLVIDLNRQLDDPTSIPEISDGTKVPANVKLAAASRAARVAALFDPYHAALDDALARLGAAGVPVLISVHSFTPVFNGFVRPWQVGVLWNRDPRLAVPLIASLRERGIEVGDNQPYSAREGQGYTVKHHAEAKGLPHVMLEIRQDLIDTHHGAAHWAGVIAEALRGPLALPELRERKRY